MSCKKNISNTKYTRGFTLLELLIVIAILAILTTVVVMVLNPAEYLAQARDTKRSVDMANINKALQMYDFDNPGVLAQQSSTTIYISLPDTVSTCTTYTLPTLPAGYTYHCVTEANLRKTDGTGWIPVNFTTISGGSPLSSLPTDPTNSATNRTYYSYVQGGSWELVTPMESTLYKMGGGKDLTSTDKGKYTGLYETGTSYTLMPIDYGDSSLVGYWPMDEGIENSCGSSNDNCDYSGNNVNGNWTGTFTSTANGKVNGAGVFDGGPSYVNFGDNALYDFGSNNFTISAWAYRTAIGTNDATIVAKWNTGGSPSTNEWILSTGVGGSTSQKPGFLIESGSTSYTSSSTDNMALDSWHHILGKRENNYIYIYVDGVNKGSSYIGNIPVNNVVGRTVKIAKVDGGSLGFFGYVDDVRIYNKALSDAEISALYSATK